jgi:hypothetical protein
VFTRELALSIFLLKVTFKLDYDHHVVADVLNISFYLLSFESLSITYSIISHTYLLQHLRESKDKSVPERTVLVVKIRFLTVGSEKKSDKLTALVSGHE